MKFIFVINSINEKVVENTIINLMEHVYLFEDIGYKEGKIVLHLGGANGGKEAGIERFITDFKKYPYEITSRIILENDRKHSDYIDVDKFLEFLEEAKYIDRDFDVMRLVYDIYRM